MGYWGNALRILIFVARYKISGSMGTGVAAYAGARRASTQRGVENEARRTKARRSAVRTCGSEFERRVNEGTTRGAAADPLLAARLLPAIGTVAECPMTVCARLVDVIHRIPDGFVILFTGTVEHIKSGFLE